jgi:hypothetical protein
LKPTHGVSVRRIPEPLFIQVEKTVKLRETATVWTSGSKENYDKKTGYRVGITSRCRLLLDTIKPIENPTESQLPQNPANCRGTPRGDYEGQNPLISGDHVCD